MAKDRQWVEMQFAPNMVNEEGVEFKLRFVYRPTISDAETAMLMHEKGLCKKSHAALTRYR